MLDAVTGIRARDRGREQSRHKINVTRLSEWGCEFTRARQRSVRVPLSRNREYLPFLVYGLFAFAQFFFSDSSNRLKCFRVSFILLRVGKSVLLSAPVTFNRLPELPRGATRRPIPVVNVYWLRLFREHVALRSIAHKKKKEKKWRKKERKRNQRRAISIAQLAWNSVATSSAERREKRTLC